MKPRQTMSLRARLPPVPLLAEQLGQGAAARRGVSGDKPVDARDVVLGGHAAAVLELHGGGG